MDITLELMKHSILEGERILLRPVGLVDAADMFEYASDEETTRFVFETHRDRAMTEEAIANYFMAAPAGKYALVVKHTKKMIGTIDIRPNMNDRIAEIGYTLNKDYRGNGYMTEAGKLVTALAFEVLGMEKVFAMHDILNPASGEVMKRLGMQPEGVLRRHKVFKGRSCDMAYYGILNEEYLLQASEV
ncbi:ribosomal-protein-alanine N-acetyltransferase [Trichococcus patagoniensis]|uniref:Ribosomal-protein-alanine N-acetyltransferase n=1 Tax=Trichococcus patagoniensis TaxID=382641 RepID=A0A2T5I956_9LACT|nr:GNAT family protein [Trichococcus patagoniensis]PTQ80359.1 ribosomal-protein-alanine N-acetyltransferase [Trichococcus patagoniensis]